jgi:hypothetical protein
VESDWNAFETLYTYVCVVDIVLVFKDVLRTGSGPRVTLQVA